MPEWVRYGLYFVLGGTLVSVSTYLGSHGRGFLAALASTLPVISGVTFVLIFINAGSAPTISFAKHMIWLSPPWFMYVGTMIAFVPKLGFWPAYGLAIGIYLAGVGLTRLLLPS
ncbi:MAG TPA: DUF3147 domain-containing protein [Nitrospirales bacterium]|nr:DUF3147 domain-containing protein [Nitrospiraceae bacterium]HNP31371.1 DUF3147 domain-containing protein [Nitrospirales bacterium]